MTKQYAKKMHKKMWLIVSELETQDVNFAKEEALAKMRIRKRPILDCYMCEIYAICAEGCPFKNKYKKEGCTDMQSPYIKANRTKSQRLWKKYCLEIANMWE